MSDFTIYLNIVYLVSLITEAVAPPAAPVRRRVRFNSINIIVVIIDLIFIYFVSDHERDNALRGVHYQK